jgi:hypothetical protein
MTEFAAGDIVRVVSQPLNQRFVHLINEVGVLSEVKDGHDLLETFGSGINSCGGSGWVTLASLVHEHDPVYVAKKQAKDAAREKYLQEGRAFNDRINGIEKGLAEKHGIPVDAVKDIYNTLANAYP